MFKSYFKTALRSLVKRKGHSFINIAGLSAGMAVAMLIGLWIWDELSYDTYHQNYDRIAKVRQHALMNGEIQTGKTVPYPLAEELKHAYGSSFKYVVLSSHRGSHVIAYGDKLLNKHGVYLQPQAPDMLTLNMLQGTRDGLQDPSSILLSASAAKAIFGDADPMDKIVRIDDTLQVKVTGVFENLPANSTFASLDFIAPFDLYVNHTRWISNQRDSWNSSPVQAYVQIADGADMAKVSAMIRNVRLNKVSTEEAKYKPVVFLDPMRDWHLYPEFKNGLPTSGKMQYVWMFGIIGVFVLLLACINFMNLSTARSEKRAKEVGIRKAVGSLRGQLISQFYCESLLVAGLAFLFSLLLVWLTLPFFNEVANKKMAILWGNPLFWLMGIGFTIITGLVAGSYPALYLSSFQPVKVLKGTFRVGRLAAMPRKVLVVVQFTVSVTLIICTIIVFRQIQFAKNRPVGYDKNALVIVPRITQAVPEHLAMVKDELLKTGAITSIAGSESTTTDVWGTAGNLDWAGKDPNVTIDFPVTGVSVDYGKAAGWQFIAGRDFSQVFHDSAAIILNEAAVQYMGLQNPVGETIRWGNNAFTVIGVIKDIILESPYEPVRPSLFWMREGAANYVHVKMAPGMSTRDALSAIEKVFKKYDPAAPFDYKFADEEYDKKFAAEQRAGTLAGFFAILAVFISCLGLFGMASFMAEQRIKEIGIRKVLGASVLGLWQLLSKDFVILVIISLFIAIPLAWYFMHNWLQSYSYRSVISWWIFAAAGLGAIAITLFTVSFQAIKAALANPVKALKSE